MCGRKMQGQHSHGVAYYRCRFPQECPGQQGRPPPQRDHARRRTDTTLGYLAGPGLRANLPPAHHRHVPRPSPHRHVSRGRSRTGRTHHIRMRRKALSLPRGTRRRR
ncbi:hypothetical protein [Micromonospora sp. NPDC023633]|uniref:hypothetical protein n=1 Tax=Micromonospora sp. NPDC023633 TaxID=3154320 RepID=UPI0033ED4020